MGINYYFEILEIEEKRFQKQNFGFLKGVEIVLFGAYFRVILLDFWSFYEDRCGFRGKINSNRFSEEIDYHHNLTGNSK